MAKPDASKKPRIAVLERRLQNPFGEPSAPIDLKDPTRVARWFNGAITADHIWRAKYKGWDQVRPDDVVDLDQVGGYVLSPEGYLTRGERGQEVLMAMPKDWREQIQVAKTQANLSSVGNPHQAKRDIVEAAGQKIGDEAASYLNKRVAVVGEVTDQYERIQRSEPE